MDENTILALVKERLGLRSAIRDTYIAAIVRSVLTELDKEQGLELDSDNMSHVMFCVDFATWRYQSRDSEIGMPRHLKYRLNNLIISTRRGDQL